MAPFLIPKITRQSTSGGRLRRGAIVVAVMATGFVAILATVSMRAQGNLGAAAALLSKGVGGGPPSTTASFSPAGTGLAGATVFTFSAAVAGGTAPVTYLWDFGDGQSASGRITTHTYSSAGPFTAVVTATD